jgi:Leucine-rich repeat (LRR) protein
MKDAGAKDAGFDAGAPADDATVDALDASIQRMPIDGSDAGDECSAINPGSNQGAFDSVWGQHELEALRGCRKFEGDLILGGKDITDLSPLESLEEVSGRLAIGTRFPHWRLSAELLPITNLSALAKLRTAGSLELSALQVSDFHDLRALAEVGVLLLEKLEGPRDLAGLEAVQWTKLQVEECHNLLTLEGLTASDTVDSLRLSKNSKLTDLSALQPVHIARNVSLQEMPVDDLSGLSGLEQITEVINFTSCSNLVDLTGLGKLDARAIVLVTNPQLRSTAGLRLLGQPEIELYENEKIAELMIGVEEGFERIQSLRSIRQPNLSSLQGMKDVKTIGNLSIGGSHVLKDLSGLEGLTQADGISLDSNSALVSLTGLGNLSSKLTSFSLSMNESLTSLRALASTPGADSGSITGNSLLPECEVSWLSQIWDLEIESFNNSPSGTCSN